MLGLGLGWKNRQCCTRPGTSTDSHHWN